MKLDRIMWGIVLLFVGGVLLLENFNVITFYWGSVWRFWPIFLILAGINILFNRQRSQLGMALSVGVLVVMLGFIFYKGQQPTDNRNWIADNFHGNIDLDSDDEDSVSSGNTLHFSEPFNLDSAKHVVLNVSGGGTSFDLKGETDSLIAAEVTKSRGSYSLQKTADDSVQVVTFKMQEGDRKWSMKDGSGQVDFKINKNPQWEINMSMGAGEVDFDMSDYKVRTFKFDGGAAALDVTVGDLLPITDVIIKTGVADVSIKVPATSGCRVKAKTGLSSKNFTGFTKIDENTYESPNYKTSTKKVFVTFDGGLSSFEVKRY